MKKCLVSLLMGVLILGGWASLATAGDPDATHTVLVEFGTTTW
ncbi:MAG: hypothetical protein ACYTG7_05895 [Planctomycetota bacterium]|jgi:hypothetical protein